MKVDVVVIGCDRCPKEAPDDPVVLQVGGQSYELYLCLKDREVFEARIALWLKIATALPVTPAKPVRRRPAAPTAAKPPRPSPSAPAQARRATPASRSAARASTVDLIFAG